MHSYRLCQLIVPLFFYFSTILLANKAEATQRNCYLKGTEQSVGNDRIDYCPCKFGHYGPDCMGIHSCMTGELYNASCKFSEISDNDDLLWRCLNAQTATVEICKCPKGFRGETCNIVVENSLSTFYTKILAMNSFFETSEEVEESYENRNTWDKKYGPTIRVFFFLCCLTGFIRIVRAIRSQPKKLEQELRNRVEEHHRSVPLISDRYLAPPKYEYSSNDLLLSNTISQDSNIEEGIRPSGQASSSTLIERNEVNEEENKEVERIVRPSLHV